MSEWKKVKIGDFLTYKKRQVVISPDDEYSLVTITKKGEIK